MRKLLLIGWDAADWKVIHPAMDRGELPGLQRLVENGTMGNLTTIHPVLSPMLWTSIATGKRPYNHGVHGFTEPAPDGESIRPVSSLSRRCKAIWNILNQQGLRSHVLGWWPSHPVEPINGVMVSNHYHRATGPIDEPWLIEPGTIHPSRLEADLADLRLHPAELVPEQLLPFIPRVVELNRTEDPRVSILAKILAECSTIHAAATHVINSEPWDFMAVYFDAIDHFSHAFMRFHPPQQEGIENEDFQLFGNVINAAYQLQDMMLQRLLAFVDDQTTVMLISDHGFHPDHLRPKRIPREPAGPAVEHRDHGIFVVKGPGIRQDHLIHSASVLDIAPTILTLFDLPVGQDMDGQPLSEILSKDVNVKTIPSWEDVPGETGMHAAETHLDPAESRQAIEQLVALGYIEPPSEDAEQVIAGTVRESRYNLAQAYMDGGLIDSGVAILKELWEESPMDHRFGVRLAGCYDAMGQTADQRRVVETMMQRRQDEVTAAKQTVLDLEKKAAEQRNKDDTHSGDGNGPLASLSESDQITYLKMRSVADFDPYFMHYLMGSVCHTEGNHEEALKHLAKAEEAQPRALGLHRLLGHIYFDMRRDDDAHRSYERVLSVDPDDAHAHLGLARVALRRKEPQLAAERSLVAIGLQYHFPPAHFVLGNSLNQLKRETQAIEAMEVAVAQNSHFLRARRRLAELYDHAGQSKLAAEQREIADELERKSLDSDEGHVKGDATKSAVPHPDDLKVEQPLNEVSQASIFKATAPSNKVRSTRTDDATITVVSGLPRSGTSMMMQMLASGGMEILADKHRNADEDNPRGYFEYQPVRSIRKDNQWITLAQGKAVKIVSQLLEYLPERQYYRVVFMERSLDEVLASQQSMLERQGSKGSPLSSKKLAQVFAKQTAAARRSMAQRQDVEILLVDYATAIFDPLTTAKQVNQFLGGSLDWQSMTNTVDARLYRNRGTNLPK